MSRKPASRYTHKVKTMFHVVMGVVVVMTTSVLRDVTARCPATCFCQTSSLAVFCSRRGLDAVPDTVPSGTRQLHLNGNHFKSPVICRANFSQFPHVIKVRGSLKLSTYNINDPDFPYRTYVGRCFSVGPIGLIYSLTVSRPNSACHCITVVLCHLLSSINNVLHSTLHKCAACFFCLLERPLQ